MNIRQQLRKNKPEIKILIILCYYFLVGAFMLSGVIVPAVNYLQFIAAASNYFLCESTGVDPNKNACERSFEKYDSRIVFTTCLFLIGVLPIVDLLFVLNVQETKKILSRPLERRRTQHSLTHLSQICLRVTSSTETLR